MNIFVKHEILFSKIQRACQIDTSENSLYIAETWIQSGQAVSLVQDNLCQHRQRELWT